MNARGVVFVHSSPTAVCPHVEWAISGVLGAKVSLSWTPQPAVHGQMRAECSWTGPAGSGGALAAALRAWSMLRFEVTEEPTPGVDGERYCHVPTLGLWRGTMSANGCAGSTSCSVRSGTKPWSPSVGPATVLRSPGCTRSGEARRACECCAVF